MHKIHRPSKADQAEYLNFLSAIKPAIEKNAEKISENTVSLIADGRNWIKAVYYRWNKSAFLKQCVDLSSCSNLTIVRTANPIRGDESEAGKIRAIEKLHGIDFSFFITEPESTKDVLMEIESKFGSATAITISALAGSGLADFESFISYAEAIDAIYARIKSKIGSTKFKNEEEKIRTIGTYLRKLKGDARYDMEKGSTLQLALHNFFRMDWEASCGWVNCIGICALDSIILSKFGVKTGMFTTLGHVELVVEADGKLLEYEVFDGTTFLKKPKFQPNFVHPSVVPTSLGMLSTYFYSKAIEEEDSFYKLRLWNVAESYQPLSPAALLYRGFTSEVIGDKSIERNRFDVAYYSYWDAISDYSKLIDTSFSGADGISREEETRFEVAKAYYHRGMLFKKIAELFDEDALRIEAVSDLSIFMLYGQTNDDAYKALLELQSHRLSP